MAGKGPDPQVTPTHTDGIDVRLVAGEGLPAHPFSHIPEFSGSITSTGHKQPGVRSEREAHDVPGVSRERGRLLTRLNVPQSTGAETRHTVTSPSQRTRDHRNLCAFTQDKFRLAMRLWKGNKADTTSSHRCE